MRPLALPALAGLALLLSCTGDAPAGPDGLALPRGSVVANSCTTIDALRLQVNALFPAGKLNREASTWITQIQKSVKQPDLPTAQAKMLSLVDYTIKSYYAHQLIGDQGATTQATVVSFIDNLYCYVGLTSPHIPIGALGDDGVVAVIGPTTPAQTVVTPSAQAGVDLPAAAAPATTVLAVFRLPDSPNPLNTALDQYPAYYEFQVSPVVSFTQDVVVGACQLGTFAPVDYGRLKLGHNLGGTGFELLPKATPAFLDCTGLASTGDVTADGTCCLGGTTKNFSPFGAVDTLTTMDAASFRSVPGTPNTPMPANLLPAVQIITPSGRPVPGISITFTVPAGSEGSVSGATQVTDANGIARVGGWVLGPGALPNTVIATGTPIPGSGISRNGLSCTATLP